MATVQRAARGGAFWVKSVSEEEKPLSFVPGSNRGAPFMKRGTVPGPKTRPRIDPETRHTTRLGPRQNSAGGSGPEEVCMVPFPQMDSHRSQTCLKDLCPEDKKRISNLIQELARVSEEQEVSTQRFRDEQSQFEHKIESLEQQNQMIAKERESLQHQYRECQELLKLHQLYLLEQTHYLSQNSTQVRGEELAAPVCNGSYLSLVPPHEQQEHYQRTSSQPPAPPTSSLSSSDQWLCVKEHTKSPLESQHWHQRKRQLLKQKVTLEEERDRLQRRLTEHEEQRRLTEHEEQRRLTEHEEQRRLTELEEQRRLTELEERRRLTELEEQRKLTELEEQRRLTELEERRRLTELEERRRLTELEERRRLTELEERRRMTKHEEQTGRSEKSQSPQTARKSTEIHLPKPSRSREPQRRDIGTSPDPHSTPQTRLDLSLTELLDVFSPVRSSTYRPRAGPAPYTGPAPVDLEESRILEDIFFIC